MLQDIITGADSCVTSLACDTVNRSLLIAGCGDSTVRIYDRRVNSHDRSVCVTDAFIFYLLYYRLCSVRIKSNNNILNLFKVDGLKFY